MITEPKKDKYYGERGQTLNEAIIAVSLLTFGVIGMLGGIVRSLSQTGIVADRMTATFLAAEGVEIAKNIVDGRGMRNVTDPEGKDWGKDFTQGEYYQLDFYDVTSTVPGKKFANVNPDESPTAVGPRLTPLKTDAASPVPIFSYSGTQTAPFRRLVGASVNSGNRMKIKSYVYWQSKGGIWYGTSTETDLLNWR